MKKVVILVIVILFLLGCSQKDPTGSYSLPSGKISSESIEDEYKKQVLIMANFLRNQEKISEINTGFQEIERNFPDIIYVGLVLANYTTKNSVLKETVKGGKFFSDLGTMERSYNRMVPLYNKLIDKSKTVSKNSEKRLFDEFSGDIGEFSARSVYLYLRMRTELLAKFLQSLYETVQQNEADDEQSKELVIRLNKGLPILDHVLFELSGKLGRITGPTFLQGTASTEEFLEKEIIPSVRERVREFSEQLTKQIEEANENRKK